MHRREGTNKHRRLHLFYHFGNMQVTCKITETLYHTILTLAVSSLAVMPSVIPIKMEWKMTPHSNVIEAVVYRRRCSSASLGSSGMYRADEGFSVLE